MQTEKTYQPGKMREDFSSKSERGETSHANGILYNRQSITLRSIGDYLL
jgi:hypothetical protein